MRILLIGARGMLGTDILNEWQDADIQPANSADADIRNAEQVRALVARARPDWILLTAAYTDVDGCERDPELAFAVNTRGTENVARAAQAYKARVLYVSSDYVFDGTATRPYEPTDAISPINVYGQSKAGGERALQENLHDWCIVRTSWMFGASGSSFPEKILRAAETRPELSVVADQVGNPTFTRDLAQAIRSLVHAEARGILNVTNAGSCSWFDFACEILRQSGKDKVRVVPIDTARSGRAAKRPHYSVLSPAGLNARGITVRHWRDTLPGYFDELREKGKLVRN